VGHDSNRDEIVLVTIGIVTHRRRILMSTVATAVSFQIALNVADVGRSLRFYRTLLGVEPVQESADQARFELDDPPLILGLAHCQQIPGGSLNHIGFRLADSAALVDLQRRLEEVGITTQRQEGVECCYARQTKFWVTDPDRNLWELYVFEEDIDHSGFENAPWNQQAPAPTTIWEHRLTEPVPERIPHGDATVDEVRFEGTFNLGSNALWPTALLAEAFRVLRPAGKLTIHGLAGNRSIESPRLPGLAALVQRVPALDELFAGLSQVGFVGMYCEKLKDVVCLPVGGLDLHETLLVAWRPTVPASAMARIVYKGPLESVTIDDGLRIPRGAVVSVPEGVWQTLLLGPAAEHFVRLAPLAR